MNYPFENDTDHFIIGTVRSYIFPCSKLSEFF